MDAESERRARAEARRATATLLRTNLARVEQDIVPLRGEEAVSLVHQLTRTSWSMAGRSVPTYTRAETPIRFVLWRDR
jgi:hypothetical protein